MSYLFDNDYSSRSFDLKAMKALHNLPWAKIFLVVLASWSIFATAQVWIKAYRSPLSNVPGPWIARYTRFWLLRAITTRSWQKINIRLHREHGPIVRISPNEYSIDDPDAARIIYRTRNELVKGKRYLGWGLPDVEQNVFTQMDIERHNQRKKEASGFYSNSVLYNMEAPVDRVMEVLFGRFSGFAETGEVIEMFDWLHYFASDAIGIFTFGKTFGFLETGQDLADIMKTIHDYGLYGGLIGVFVAWHSIALKIKTALASGGDVGLAYLIKFTAQTIAELDEKGHDDKEGKHDLLSLLLAKHHKDPERFTKGDVHFHILPNVVAGAETTGISLSAAVYFLWKNPHTLAKLRHELDARRSAGTFHDIVTAKDVKGCQYLQAVIKETLRMHPGTGIGLTRLVPRGGLTLAGRFFPEGTEVNINPWVAHANRTVFGEDADSFRPERWLQDEETISQMDNYLLTFGKGARICSGKNISLMEMNKLISELVMRFDFEFEDPEREWTVHNDWFVRQEDFRVRVKKR